MASLNSKSSLGNVSRRSNQNDPNIIKREDKRSVSMDLPERFRIDDEDEEDASKLDEQNPETYVQQSMYGILAAAQTKGNMGADLQPFSGSDSDSDGDSSKGKSKDTSQITTSKKEASRKPSLGDEQQRASRAGSSSHRKQASESRNMLRSFLKPIQERSDSQGQDNMSQSQILQPKERIPEEAHPSASDIRTDAPIMDRKLQAIAKADLETSSSSISRKSRESSPRGAARRKAALALPDALADIFQFDTPEEVISEYACWYLQSVLLQGYMYITQKHVCFYAYLQKKGSVLKSGHLAKQGKRNPRYRRYWFILKGDVLSYYTSAAEPYFPNGTIDLRSGISAELLPEKGQDKDQATTFTVTTDKRAFFFRADSVSSAKEWVRQLQKVIFRSHNDGDSVKISLPLENIVDVEPNRVIDFAETIKVRVIDNDESYAVDEYFFTFFNRGKDALNVLNLMTQDNHAKKMAAEILEAEAPLQRTKSSPFRRSTSIERSPRLSQSTAIPIPEPVRSTLSPTSPRDRSSPRVSGEQSRRSSNEVSRSSFDRGRNSLDRGRRIASPASRTSSQWKRGSKSPLSSSAQESSESFVTTSEHAAATEGNEDHMSASQMLSGDGVFRGPTLKKPQAGRSTLDTAVKPLRHEPSDTHPSSRTEKAVRMQPPTRMQTESTLTGSPTKLEPTLSELSAGRKQDQQSSSTAETSSTTGRSKRAMATPLQHAFTLAGVVRDQSKRMSSYLSSSPKNYYEKFSGAIAGGKRHYSDADGLNPEDRIDDLDDDHDTADHERRFQQHFALPETERLRAVYYCWLHRVLPLYGKIYISDRRFCFRSLLYGTRTKLVVPFRDIDNVGKEKGFRWGYPGMVLMIRGHEELFFDFGSHGLRDDCAVTVLRSLDVTRAALQSVILSEEDKLEAEAAAAENKLLQGARQDKLADHDDKMPSNFAEYAAGATPIMFDDPNASVLDFRPKQSLSITCLTIGSRGDVQPYIALCKGLIAHGHHAKIATHAQFEGWIRKHGVDFAPVEGDPAELMKLCVENGMFTPSFVYETSSNARVWLDGLMSSAWKACQGCELLIESPSAMVGIHIAEALGVPYFRAFTMPWTKTRAYPHAFAVPPQKMGGQYNYLTYLMFDQLFWQMTSGQINRWRGKALNLKPTDLSKMQPNKVPFLYNFSPSVVVPPLDFSDWVRITGYWFLDEAHEWTPPKDLLAFIEKARKDGLKLVYIGFGSVPVSDTQTLTQQIVDAVLKADVRCIFSKGWSDHFDKNHEDAPQLPSAIFQIRSAPHDWLFKQIDAAVHHGGAGTTGASLRAGIPTVIKPFFGDQFFFATRVEDLGVGMHLKKISVNTLGKALWLATNDERMRTKARMLGEQIRQENGVENAINAIYRDLEYARTLIKKRDIPIRGEAAADDDDDAEESWTFVENESDVDVTGARRGTDFSWYGQASMRSSLGSVARGRIT